MLLRRVLPLAFLLPLGCEAGPAPGAGAAASGSVPALPEPAGPPAAVDTTWPVRRVARWGFSFRWPAARWLTLVGPRDAACGGPPGGVLYQENGLPFGSADTAIRPSLVVRLVRQLAVDSLLGEEGFRRSAASPSGWVGPGEADAAAPARFGRGGRWWELLAPPPGADSAAGGASARGLAVVTRPDRCRLVVAWSADLLAPSAAVDRWRLLESLRFTGEDEAHELRGLQAFAGFDWHRRLGLIYPPVLHGACLIVANATVPEGAPVLALTGGGAAPAWATLAPAGEQCAGVPRQPGDSLHYYDLTPVDPAPVGPLEGVGVLAPPRPLPEGDPAPADLDGDGRPDSVGFCSARGLYWGYVRSGSATGPVVWKLGIHWPERTAPRCPADVVP